MSDSLFGMTFPAMVVIMAIWAAAAGDGGDIQVADYFTKNLPPPLQEKELQRAIRRAREQLAQWQSNERELPKGDSQATGE